MSVRLQRVEALLQREIAAVVLLGDLRDPRLRPLAAITITGVRVSADLGSARVFVDVPLHAGSLSRVLAGLNAGAGRIRAELGSKIRLKRVPALRFEKDVGAEHGRAIEEVLAEIQPSAAPSPEDPESA